MISGTRYQLTLEIARQQKLSSDIARAQADISTGKRIQAPSDDPGAADRVSQLTRSSANDGTYSNNVKLATARASQADGTLSSVASALDRVRELTIAAANGTLNDSDRALAANELADIAVDLQSYQDVKDSTGQPIFAAGDAMMIPISEGVQVAAAGDGPQVFGNVATGSGAQTLIDIVNNVAAALAIADPAARNTAMQDALASVTAGIDHIAGEREVQGLRAARLDTATDRLAQVATTREEERSGLEDTDIAATTIRLNANELSLQAAQSVYARVNRSTLFDLLG